MKYVVMLITGLIIAFGGIFLTQRQTGSETAGLPKPSPTPETIEVKSGKTVEWKGEKYKYYLQATTASSTFKLINNLTAKLPSEELMSQNNCLAGINGGFYDTEGRPLGLLIADGVTIRAARDSSLFNGFIYSESDKEIRLNEVIPEGKNPASAVQTGPILIKAGVPIDLRLATDKPARRMVMADVGSGRSVIAIMAIISENSVVDGPWLNDLPEIVEMIGKQEGWLGISMAVNLDGGSASAFYNQDFSLSEWSAVGSWWCLK